MELTDTVAGEIPEPAAPPAAEPYVEPPVELVKYRLPSTLLNKYRTAYRTLTFSLNRSSEPRVLFEDDRVFYENDLLWSTDLFFIWVLSDFIPFANSLKKPWMLVHGDTVLLNKMEFSKQELQTIEKEGLHIFMYEPLFIINQDHSWPWLPQNGPPKFAELDEILKFKNLKVPKATIKVFLCEYGLSQYMRDNNYYEGLEFSDFSTLLMHEVRFNTNHAWPTLPLNDIEKKMVCLNFRYESIREMLVAYLRANEFHKYCFVSFFHKHIDYEFYKRLPFNPRDMLKWGQIELGISQMQDELPYTLDSMNTRAEHPVQGFIPDINGHNMRDPNRAKREFFAKSFVFAYVESRPFSPSSEMSEKTIHPILSMRPFLPFAAKGYLATLRRMGFKTFGEFWDESFDDIDDTAKRFDAYLNVVHHICSQDLNTLKKWGEKMQPLLEHNRLWMMRDLISSEKARVAREMQPPLSGWTKFKNFLIGLLGGSRG